MKEIEKGSSNVYADLDMPDAGEMLIKAQLATKIAEIIKQRRINSGAGSGTAQHASAQTFQYAARTVSRHFRSKDAGMSHPLRP